LFIFVIYSLFTALKIMQEKNPKISMSKYLGRRLFLSLAILFIILFSISLGFLTPNPKPY